MILTILALALIALLFGVSARQAKPLAGIFADTRGLITPANLAFWFTKLDTQLGYTYSITPTFTEAIASLIPSSTEQNGYAWIGRLDKMRLWQGSRIVHEPAPQTYFLTNQPFETTQAIDRFKLDDDQMGVYERTMPEMAIQAKKNSDYQMRDLLESLGAQTGVRQNGLDGLTFWNTAHPIDLYNAAAGTYSNDFSGGGANVTYPNGKSVLTGGAFGPTAVSTLYSYMLQLKAENGEPLGVMPSDILIPTSLATEAELVLKSAFFAPLRSRLPNHPGVDRRGEVVPHRHEKGFQALHSPGASSASVHRAHRGDRPGRVRRAHSLVGFLEQRGSGLGLLVVGMQKRIVTRRSRDVAEENRIPRQPTSPTPS